MIDPILHSLLAMAQATAPAAAPVETLQAQFDAANTAYAEKRCADAIPLYDALERRTAGSRNAVLVGAIAVRKGICLVRTGGAGGIADIRRGLPALAKNPGEFAADLTAAYLSLGNSAYDALDYDAAAADYRDALSVAEGTERILPLLALSRTLAFDHDGKALAYADEARRVMLTDPTIGKETVAAVQTRYARVLLNEGRIAEAYTVLKDSLKKQGGLDSRVSLSEIATRADLALAALLNGDREKARTYLAYTGAGRLEKAPFAGARQMEMARCGAATGLKPDDVAVVEFALGDDGIVRSVAPIYTTGNRAVALAFARAVADWSWAPDDAKAIPSFWRQSARIELRCSNATERPSVRAPLDEAVDAWLTAQGSPRPDWADLPAARGLSRAQAEAGRARVTGDRAGLVRALLWILDSQLLTGKEKRPLAAEALSAAQAANAPPAVLTRLRIEDSGANARDYAAAVRDQRELLKRPDIAADPLSAATMQMLIASDGVVFGPAERAQMVDAVLASPLPDNHPLKVAALLVRADLSAQRGDVAGAQAAFRRTGLTADQCALIAPAPAVQRQGATSDLYPIEALSMGFEGWAKVEFDIGADGRTLTRRTVAAYPPFVFGDAAQKMIAATRYRSSFRPENDTACTGNAVRILFNLPR